MFEFQSVRRSFPRNIAENSEAASFLDQTTSFETEVQEREPWDFYEWITCNEKPRCAPNIFRQAEYFFFIEILTSVLTIQSSISQFEFLFEQLSTIKLFPRFHIQMVVVPFLRNNPSAVMFFQRFIFPAKTLWEKYSERIWVFHCK